MASSSPYNQIWHFRIAPEYNAWHAPFLPPKKMVSNQIKSFFSVWQWPVSSNRARNLSTLPSDPLAWRNAFTTFTRNTCCCSDSVSALPWTSLLYFFKDCAMSWSLVFLFLPFLPLSCLPDLMWYLMLLFLRGNSSRHPWQNNYPATTLKTPWNIHDFFFGGGRLYSLGFTSIFSVFSSMTGWIAEMLFMLFFGWVRIVLAWLMSVPIINLLGVYQPLFLLKWYAQIS